jgi:hypothetical protein
VTRARAVRQVAVASLDTIGTKAKLQVYLGRILALHHRASAFCQIF